MADDVTELKIKILSDDAALAKRRLDDLTDAGRKTENSTKSLASTSGVLKAGLAGVAAAAGILSTVVVTSTRNWLEYDVAIKEVGSISGQTAKEFQSMREDVLKLSVAMGVDATTAAKGLYEAISAGIPKENAIEFLGVASKAAIAGVTDVKTSVDVLTNVINAYKKPVSEAAEISDKLFATVVVGKTTMEELSASMSKGTVPAAALGVSLEELLASVAAITLQGTPTAEAFTQINATINALINPSDEMAEVLKKMGFESGRAAIAALGFGETLERVRSTIGNNDAALFKALRSIEAFKGELSLTGVNADTFKKSLDSVTDSAGKSDKAFADNAKTLQNAQAALSSSFTLLVENFESKFGALRTLGALLKDAANGIASLGESQLINSASGVGGAAGTQTLLDSLSSLRGRRSMLEGMTPDEGGYITNEIVGLDAEIQKTISALEAMDATAIKAAGSFQTLRDIENSNITPEEKAELVQSLNMRLEEQRQIQEGIAFTEENIARNAQEQSAISIANAEAAAKQELHLSEIEKIAEKLSVSAKESLEFQIRDLETLKASRPEKAAMAQEAIDALQKQLQLLDERNAKENGASAGLLPPPLPFGIQDVLISEEENITQSYARRQESILNATAKTEEERNNIVSKGQAETLQTIHAATVDQQKLTLSAYSDFFGNLGSMQSSFGEKGFKIAQAASIAQATIKMYESAVSAYASGAAIPGIGYITGPLFAGAAIAAGAANIASIKSQSYKAYAQGGMIGAGQVGLVGEAGPEFVRGPAIITSAAATANQRRGKEGSGESKPTQIIINNLPGQYVETKETDGPDMKTVEFTLARLTSEAVNGGGKVWPAYNKTHGQRRKP